MSSDNQADSMLTYDINEMTLKPDLFGNPDNCDVATDSWESCGRKLQARQQHGSEAAKGHNMILVVKLAAPCADAEFEIFGGSHSELHHVQAAYFGTTSEEFHCHTQSPTTPTSGPSLKDGQCNVDEESVEECDKQLDCKEGNSSLPSGALFQFESPATVYSFAFWGDSVIQDVTLKKCKPVSDLPPALRHDEAHADLEGDQKQQYTKLETEHPPGSGDGAGSTDGAGDMVPEDDIVSQVEAQVDAPRPSPMSDDEMNDTYKKMEHMGKADAMSDAEVNDAYEQMEHMGKADAALVHGHGPSEYDAAEVDIVDQIQEMFLG